MARSGTESEVLPVSEGERELRRIQLHVEPTETFPVPHSDGYSVYSGLLGVLSDIDPPTSDHIHDSDLGSLSCSGLLGQFGHSDRSYHKTVLAGEVYELTLGIIDPADAEIFQALVEAVVLEGDSIELTNGTLRVNRFESENTTHAELVERANELEDPTIQVDFRTATCIEEAGGVTTLFPYRWAVFNSLLGKWNRTCPEKLKLDLDRETILGSLIEKPDVDSYDTHSVLVSRGENDEGENRNIFKQGFTGECAYAFKDASDSVQNAVTALALFSEYSGVGSAVARGCGNVEVKIS